MISSTKEKDRESQMEMKTETHNFNFKYFGNYVKESAKMMAQSVKLLLSMHEVLSPDPWHPHKNWML